MKTILLLFCLLVTCGCINGRTKPGRVIWIDVRTDKEFKSGHMPDALNIPFDVIQAEIAKVTQDLDTQILVYCRTGRRSGIAKQTLEKMGYRHVTNKGGYEDLMKSLKK